MKAEANTKKIPLISTIPLMSRELLKLYQEVPEEMLKLSRERTIEHDKKIIDEVLQEGQLFLLAGLTPAYLYDRETMTFTVTSQEYLNSSNRMN